MLNVQITKRRENATADKSNVNPLFIAREVKASIHPTSQGNTSEVIVPTMSNACARLFSCKLYCYVFVM